jgi:hypothetical protein
MNKHKIGLQNFRVVVLLLIIFGVFCIGCKTSLMNDNFIAKNCIRNYSKYFITLPMENVDIYLFIEDTLSGHYKKNVFTIDHSLDVTIKDYKKSKEFYNDFCSTAKFQGDNNGSEYSPFKYSINFYKNDEGVVHSIKINYLRYISRGKIIAIKGYYPFN